MRVLELFSGIGGLHWALKSTGMDFEIAAAMEINPVVVETYQHNFPDVNIVRRNIESLTPEEINKLKVDAIVMSPPCQPFCRTGLGQGTKDSRSSPLNHILEILPSVKFQYIFVENVLGFESSDARRELIKTLEQCRFKWQEFLLNPVTLGIPNSRLRYYLIGKHQSLPWAFDLDPETILKNLPPNISCLEKLITLNDNVWKSRRKRWNDENVSNNCDQLALDYPRCIGDVLEPPEAVERYAMSSGTASKYWNALDVVNIMSTQSCCFTKAYFHYLTGTGSILDCNYSLDKLEPLPSSANELADKKLRYFSPREVARLMCYPDEFQFPDKQTPKQLYRALGNSVNVYVVALLFQLGFSNGTTID